MAEKKMINVRLNPELWNRVKAAAGERGMTLERWVTGALEAHIAAQRGAQSNPPGSAAGGAAVDHGDLAWRVSALEQAVDYLASQIGAGFPDRTGAPATDAGGAMNGDGTVAPAPGGADPAAL